MRNKKKPVLFVIVILFVSCLFVFKGQCVRIGTTVSNSADSVEYNSLDVSIPLDGKGAFLSGTLTIPTSNEVKKKAVILIAPPHSPGRNYGFFPELSAYLSHKGIAVLCFDNQAFDAYYTSMHTQAEDILSAIAFLKNRKEFQTVQLGLVGHSEGGCTASIIAASNFDVDFLVLLSTMGTTGRDFIIRGVKPSICYNLPGIEQDTAALGKIAQVALHAFSFYLDIVEQESDIHTVKERMKNEYLRQQWEKERPKADFESYCEFAFHSEIYTARFASVARYNPLDYLPNIQVPVLAICGSKDWQVEAGNLEELKRGLELGGNKHVVTTIIEGMNHDYQMVNERIQPVSEGAMSSEAFLTISNWIDRVESR